MRLRSNAETLEFQHRQGLVTQTGSIDLSLDKGTGIRQVVAITGRARTCYTGTKLAGCRSVLEPLIRGGRRQAAALQGRTAAL